ncbi:C1 family peptidase, partial [Lactobacillus delbrueckii subsp. allosunkii]|uniref:C1 family peptidase n=1 Tax=Lactobacillus delbrueckii TaxID=1584 RepID=UPI003A8C5301
LEDKNVFNAIHLNIIGYVFEFGFFVMSHNWFKEYVYEVVVHKKYLTKDQQELLYSTPVELAPWDSLA